MLAANGLQLHSSLETCSLLTEPTTLRDALLLFSHSVTSDSLWPLWTVARQAFCPWDSPSKNTGVGCHALLQGIFPTQGSNLNLLSPALAGGFFTTESSVRPQRCLRDHIPTNTANEWLVLRSTRPAPLPQGRQLWCHLCSRALYGIKADARPLLKPLLCLASSPAFPASSPSFLKGFSSEHSFSKNPSLLTCFSIT